MQRVRIKRSPTCMAQQVKNLLQCPQMLETAHAGNTLLMPCCSITSRSPEHFRSSGQLIPGVVQLVELPRQKEL